MSSFTLHQPPIPWLIFLCVTKTQYLTQQGMISVMPVAGTLLCKQVPFQELGAFPPREPGSKFSSGVVFTAPKRSPCSRSPSSDE